MVTPAFAQQPGAPAAAKAAAAPTAPPTAGELKLKRGIDAYAAGKLARAVGALSSAMSTGNLSSQNMARALYFRGLAYRKQGKPAQAISDLTNAVWLKDGLAGAERNDAIAARAAAYKEAGLADPGDVPTSVATAAGAASGAIDRPAVRATPAAPSASAAPAWTATTASRDTTSSSSSGGIGGFFSSLFGGGESSASQPTAAEPSAPAGAPPGEVTTASTGRGEPAAVAQPAAVSSWSDATEVSQRARRSEPSPQAAARKPTRTAAVQRESAVDAGAAASAPSGKYKLQVGVLRTRAEADQLAARFMAKNASRVGARSPAVQETVFGNMGTFYRVSIGPYATADEPGKLCDQLRPTGYDCLVVTH